MHEILSNLELYICQPTDTLEKISSERNIDLNEIILLNPNLKNKEIYPGLSLNLPRLTRKFTTSKDEIKEVKYKNNYPYNNLTTNTIIPLSLLYKNYFDTLIICDEQDNLYDELIDELIDENFSFRAQNFNFRDVFKNITDSLLNIASAIETKSIELIKVIKQNIVTLLNTTINFIDEKLYKKLYDLFNMLFQYVIKLSKKSYKEAQKLFNTFLKKAKKDRQ